MHKLNKEYQNECNKSIKNYKSQLFEIVKSIIDDINTMNFTTFSNEKPYVGSKINKVFYTYNDVYRYNCPTYISFEDLHHSHIEGGDRGYIKGVCTDMNGWLKIKRINKTLSYDNFMSYSLVHGKPRFRKSKFVEIYEQESNNVYLEYKNGVNKLVDDANRIISMKFKKLTGCSLNKY